MFPSAESANQLDLPPAVSDLTKNFSNTICLEISSGLSVENAAQITSRKTLKSLIFSDSLKQILSFSKVDLTSYLTKEIFNNCANEIFISVKELNQFLLDLANRGSDERTPKPFKSFGIG